jgi:hypothetical protein
VDTEWMRERLEQYLRLCERYETSEKQSGYDYTDLMRTIDQEALALQPTVERIFAALHPCLLDDLAPLGYHTSNIDRRVRQALGIIADREEWALRLAPDSPSLSADRMHPLMWLAAATVWKTGQYRVAVLQAAVALSAHIKDRSGSHLNDRELVAQVFAADLPKTGQVRLHLAGDRVDKRWQSRQQGLHLIAQGVFAGIRNVVVHDDVEWTEHEALEQLAVLSVVARWTGATTLVKPN